MFDTLMRVPPVWSHQPCIALKFLSFILREMAGFFWPSFALLGKCSTSRGASGTHNRNEVRMERSRPGLCRSKGRWSRLHQGSDHRMPWIGRHTLISESENMRNIPLGIDEQGRIYNSRMINYLKVQPQGHGQVKYRIQTVEYYSTVENEVSQCDYFHMVKIMFHNNCIWWIHLVTKTWSLYYVPDTRRRQTGALRSRNLSSRGEVGRKV